MGVVVLEFPGEKARWGIIEVLAVLVLVFGVGITYGFWGPQLFAYLVYHGWLSGTLVSEFILGYLVQFVITVGAVFIFALLVRKNSIQALGLTGLSPRNFLNWGVGGGILLFIAILAAGVLMERLIPELPPQSFELVLQSVVSFQEFVILLLVVSVIAPFAEELYFRGFVYPVFRNRMGVVAGALLSGLFFGLAHWDPWRAVPLALAGVVLALIYEKSKSIYTCWAAHGLWNGAMGLIFYFTFYHPW
jgi:membrane protease YdiL (CAAX protease family)